MAKKAMILKQQRGSKFSTRNYNRCKICVACVYVLDTLNVCTCVYVWTHSVCVHVSTC